MKEDEPRRRRSGASWNPGTWRLRTKISVVLLLPVLVALLLAGGRVQAELAQAGGLSAVRDQMPVVQGISELGGLVDDELIHDGGAEQTAAVDAKAATIRHDAQFAQLAPELSRTLEDQLGKLADLRLGGASASAKTTAYHDFVVALSELVPAVVGQAGNADLNASADITKALMQLRVALAVARSVVAPIRRLHAAALDTARRRLPGTIERIRSGEDVDWQATESLPVDSEEEIGQLARAFDDMHRQAVRLAVGEQAEMRIQVSEMFMTLSRRSQSLVELH